jgi:hypothetical protein
MTRGLSENDCLVVYFDVLGFANIIEKDVEKIDDLLMVWSWIKSNFKKKDGIITYLFSDSTFILYPLFSQNKLETQMISRCINDTSRIMNKFLEQEFFVRGAITFGKVKFTSNLVAGESIVNAVRYEEKYCPCPFVIFPNKEFNKLTKIVEDHEAVMPALNLIQDIIFSKDNNEAMNCHIILPENGILYLKLIKEYQNRHLTEGPFDKGKFWNRSYEIIRDLYKSAEKDIPS